MTELAEIINVHPKRRITIPEGHIAVVMSKETCEGLMATCFLIRRGKKFSPEEKEFLHKATGELLLMLFEASNG